MKKKRVIILCPAARKRDVVAEEIERRSYARMGLVVTKGRSDQSGRSSQTYIPKKFDKKKLFIILIQ